MFVLRCLVLAGLLVIAGLATRGGGTTPAYALTNCSVADLSVDAEEQRFLTLINEYRAGFGAPALTMSVNLNRGASWMAKDMADKNRFSHTDSLGRTFDVRLSQCDVKPSSMSENLTAGTLRDTAQEAFDAWKASTAGHNENMKNPSWRQIGIARYYNAGSTYRWYWANNFSSVDDGTRAGGGTSPTATATRTSTPVGAATATRTPTRTATPPGVATATQTSTPTSQLSSRAAMTSPTPGATLPGSTATFNWSAGSGAQEYFLYIGTSRGANNIYGRSTALNRSATVSSLPRGGTTVYVRLWTRTSAGWQYTDYTYRAAP